MQNTTTAPAVRMFTVLFAADLAAAQGTAPGDAPADLGNGYYRENVVTTDPALVAKIIELKHKGRFAWIRVHLVKDAVTGEIIQNG